ncbi:MAG: thioredoxin family protein [Phycisphaerae bacterium]|nr:thioredoxin family protein [Phycisphaerae bacterium]
MSTQLEVRATLPDFSLPAVDGHTISASDFAEKRALVVIFSCNHCPYVKAYEDRILEIQRDYADKGVQFVLICSNDAEKYPEDSFENMKKHAAMKGYNFPYLHDESQAVARAFGAEKTPHLFVFDADRRLAYEGRIDDNLEDPAAVTRHYLREALDAIVAGEPVSESSTFAVGCTIKWK